MDEYNFKVGDPVKVDSGPHRGHTGTIAKLHWKHDLCYMINWDICTKPVPELCRWYFAYQLRFNTESYKLLYG